MPYDPAPGSEPVASFQIAYTRFLGPDGQVRGELPDFVQDAALLRRLYEAMLLTRAFDAKAVALQRTGRLGTYASTLGQEAVAVGIGSAMRPEDLLLPSFREYGAQFWRGVSPTELLLYWSGDERGSDFAGPREDFPICIPVGSQVPHATGVALAFKLRREKRVAVCVLGDGGTSKGDFYEGINMAGVWQVPAVFVVNNNQWAISVPRRAQTRAETLAQKAIAAGIPGEQVDGNDVLAVRHVVGQAIERARRDNQPSLIEAVTYRLSDHTTADDASRYRDDKEVARFWKEEPVARLRAFLVGRGLWSRQDEDRALRESAATIEAAVETYLATPPQPPEAILDYQFANPVPALEEQRAALLEELPEGGAHG